MTSAPSWKDFRFGLDIYYLNFSTNIFIVNLVILLSCKYFNRVFSTHDLEEGQTEEVSENKVSEDTSADRIHEDKDIQSQDESQNAVAPEQDEMAEGALATVAEGDEEAEVEAEVSKSADEIPKSVSVLIEILFSSLEY